mmetsp:Transcript_27495/g.49122  ORF Transcript_27495/g.49122 Transcript_27495/m.49122 type:complete len:244 (-) Transcript_27495:3602-4333(-)
MDLLLLSLLRPCRGGGGTPKGGVPGDRSLLLNRGSGGGGGPPLERMFFPTGLLPLRSIPLLGEGLSPRRSPRSLTDLALTRRVFMAAPFAPFAPFGLSATSRSPPNLPLPLPLPFPFSPGLYLCLSPSGPIKSSRGFEMSPASIGLTTLLHGKKTSSMASFLFSVPRQCTSSCVASIKPDSMQVASIDVASTPFSWNSRGLRSLSAFRSSAVRGLTQQCHSCSLSVRRSPSAFVTPEPLRPMV